MDEILFHLSQRIETLQIWISELIGQAMEQMEAVASSETVQRLQDACVQMSARMAELSAEAMHRVMVATRPHYIMTSLSSVLGPDLNRKTVYAGLMGLGLGGALGLALGTCLQSPQRPITLMRAVVATSFSGIESISLLEDAIVPSISSDDEVIVQVMCATIDQLDIEVSSGYARQLRRLLNRQNPNMRGELPLVLGRDGSGIVVEVGRGVAGLEVSDEVFFTSPPWSVGTLSQYVVLPGSSVAKKPSRLGFEGAAAVAYCGGVAWNAVVKRAGLNVRNAHKKRVFVHCGSSTTGCAVAQLCANLGSEVTATCLNRAASLLKALGVSHIVPLELDAHSLLESKFDVAFNTVGAAADELCSSLVSSGGRVIDTTPPFLPSDTYGIFMSSLYSLWIRLTHGVLGLEGWTKNGGLSVNRETLDEVRRLVESNRMQAVVDRVVAPEMLDSALAQLESHNFIGKMVVRFSGGNSSTGVQHSDSKPDLLR